LLGAGSSGLGGSAGGGGGGGGSGGCNGANGQLPCGGGGTGIGGLYGGGGPNRYWASAGKSIGAVGAVRIIWPGTTRSFPSTNTGDL
jgi:hypothetical protein